MCRLDMLMRVNRRSCAGMVIVGSVDSSQGSELLDGVRASTPIVGAPEILDGRHLWQVFLK
jgi:hypothetical protein